MQGIILQCVQTHSVTLGSRETTEFNSECLFSDTVFEYYGLIIRQYILKD